MGKKGRTGVLKRQREAKKAEKAAMKREKRSERVETEPEGNPERVATADDLAGYGFEVDSGDSGDNAEQPGLRAPASPRL